MDYFQIRALAAQNAYRDLNSDLTNGLATTANGLCNSVYGCPTGNVTLNVLGSAFANTNWGVASGLASTNPAGCSSSITTAYTNVNGATMALNNYTYGNNAATSGWMNANSFSFHSYGAAGYSGNGFRGDFRRASYTGRVKAFGEGRAVWGGAEGARRHPGGSGRIRPVHLYRQQGQEIFASEFKKKPSIARCERRTWSYR